MVLVIIAVRVLDSQMGPPLELWHTQIPDEPRAEQINRIDRAAMCSATAGSLAGRR